MSLGRILHLQRMSVHDGPGLRTTVFLKGCPMACPWCHNPESQAFGQEFATLEARCMACGSCREACPEGTAAGGAGCHRCGGCAEACPTGARRGVGDEMTPDALVKTLLRDRLFFDQSGGGVTFSGGEPLCQPAFLRDVMPRLRREGVHLALDTCGAVGRPELLELAALADLVLFDVKHLDPESHRRWTGVPLAPVLGNLEALAAVHPAVWIRVPLIPGVNDDPANLEATARLAARLPGVRQVNLLPYHAFGGHKATRDDIPRLAPTDPPTPAALDAARTLFQQHGLPTFIGG